MTKKGKPQKPVTGTARQRIIEREKGERESERDTHMEKEKGIEIQAKLNLKVLLPSKCG